VGKTVELKRAIAGLLESGVAPRRIIHASVEGWDESDLGGLVRVGRDLETRSVARFTSVQTQALLARLTASLSSPISINRVPRELSTSRATLTARVNDLHAAYLTWPC
jgi:hypothetical protein